MNINVLIAMIEYFGGDFAFKWEAYLDAIITARVNGLISRDEFIEKTSGLIETGLKGP